MSTTAVDHAHHPCADQDVTFNGLAAFSKKTDVAPWSYNPPKLQDEFVEIEISHCGICGSDIHTIDSGWGPTNYPQIVGHEIVGVVTAAGSGVTNVKVGDRVGVGAQVGSCLNRAKDCPECEAGSENHCRSGFLWTYNSKYPDGQVTQGGYADKVRCASQFAFVLPASISSAEAAPLMCAGVTVYAPLSRAITKAGMKVAIIGIGGLGHLAVMFAAKLQAQFGAVDLTAVSHNSKKKDDAMKMGATSFLDTSDPIALKAAFRTFDFVLSTANGSAMDLNDWVSTVKFDGVFSTVGLPEEALQINAFSLTGAQASVTASLIGSIKEIKEMIAFADKHNVRPIIQTMPMAKANEGIKSVRDGSVRFRVVLENPKK